MSTKPILKDGTIKDTTLLWIVFGLIATMVGVSAFIFGVTVLLNIFVFR